MGQANSSDTTIELIELSVHEVQLLKVLRNSLRFGEVVIRMRDGKPYQVVRVQEFINLGG